MINLLGALTLTVKLVICIAVFAVLIIAEILALVMLVKWRKNYKKTSPVKEPDTAVAQDTADSVAVESAQESEDMFQDTASAVDEPAETQDEAQAETQEDAQEETEAQDDTQDEVQEEIEMQEEDEMQDDTQEETQEEVEAQDDVKKDKFDSSVFAFAPFMLLSASVQATTLRYILFALIGVSVLLAAVVLITAVAFSKSLTKQPKQKPAEEKAEQPADEDIAEPVEDELPVEETAEEIAEPVEELPVEETAEEIAEPVEEELPVEETVEEVAEDEITAEEVAESVEEEKPVREETVYVVEKPIHMFVKPKLATEKKNDNVRERTVVIDNVTYTMRDDRYLFNPAENDWYMLLTKTFTAKLIQSEDYVKDYYTELKNELLSYKKVHARMSKKRESFNYGRVCLARLTIRGKTLRLHLALDAKDYEDTKYKVEDTSNIKSLADTPLMFKIKNDRRLKYAKDLIATLMAKAGAVRQEIEPVNYTAMYPYEDTEPLIERNLITRKWYQGKVPDDKGFDFAQKFFKAKLIQSDDIVKDYYSQIKNRLLSFKKVHDRMSKKRESFRFGRICVARMSIRGKTLRLYLALNPADYVDTKYKFDDVSQVKSAADTPLLLKIKNPRRLKYAFELIDVVMSNVGAAPKREIDDTDYTADLQYETIENLLEKGLAVNVHVDSNSFVGRNFKFKAKDVEDEAAADEDE